MTSHTDRSTRLLRVITAGVAVTTMLMPAAPQGHAAMEEQGGSSALVRITSLGSHAGELCRNDRAMLFEDPTGVRILYDPGRTVDEGDPRLGDVHVMLLSHAHTDHVGDARPNTTAPGTCAAPATGAANPATNFASIAAAKSAAVFAPGELADFLARKIQGVRGSATPGCAAAGLENVATVPMTAPCTAALRPGGSRTVARAGAAAGVRIAVVPAFHSNGISAQFIESPGLAPGLAGYGGGEAGFIIRFTTGLVAYLTGDSGMFGDMGTIIWNFYRPGLMVINMSDTVTFGPDEAAFTVKELVRVTSVIPSHVNEQATDGGAVRAGTRVERLMSRVRGLAEVVVPLSGVTQFFDAQGRCVGCQ